MDNRPIGIMDSGIGGLTVARVLHENIRRKAWSFWGTASGIPTANEAGRKSDGLQRKSNLSFCQKREDDPHRLQYHFL